MSLSKLFQRIIWHNNTTPAINEDNLNAMSKAIDDIDDRVILIGDDVVTVIPQIQAYLEQAQSIVEAVEQLSQNPPYIGANGNWYVFNTSTEQYEDSGVDASITVDIADITMIAEGAQPYVTNSGTNTDPVFHLFLPSAPQGATGNGISNIAKTGTQGLVDTYTITMTDGTTYTFTVTNGQGIGDMTKAVYDSTDAVADAGGIVAYVAAHSGAGSLSGLSDVSLSTLANGESLVYNSTSQKWENGSVSYSSLSGKPTLGTASAKDSTNAVTSGSTDLVESGAVYTQIQTLTNQLSNKLDKNGVWAYKGNVTRNITTDGVKTYRQLLKELADDLIPYFATLAVDVRLEADLFYGDFVGSAVADPSNLYTRTSSVVSNLFYKISYNGSSLKITYISISSGGDIYCYVKQTDIASDGTVTYTDLSDTVPPTGKSWSFRFKQYTV